MLIVVDIGNTNIVLGVFKGKELLTELRFKSDTSRTIDEHAALILPLLRERLGTKIDFHACIISSVVPLLTPAITSLVEENFRIKPIIIGPGIKTGIQIKIQDPASVGADRVVNAVAAREFYGSPVIAVDFGTATSFDYVNRDGHYEGGIIAPGLKVSLESLVARTAKLPSIELAWPKSVIGKSTVAAMQTGTVIGYVCMVDGLLRQMIKEVGEVKTILATGGLGHLISQHSECISKYERDLTLQGLRIIAELNM